MNKIQIKIVAIFLTLNFAYFTSKCVNVSLNAATFTVTTNGGQLNNLIPVAGINYASITIQAGAYAEINAQTLSFLSNGRIIVRSGAILVVKNSVLKSVQTNANNSISNYWQGITVEGDPNAFQDGGQMAMYTAQRYTAFQAQGRPDHGMLILDGIPSGLSSIQTQITMARNGVNISDGGYLYSKATTFTNSFTRDIFFSKAPLNNVQNSIIEDCTFAHTSYPRAKFKLIEI